MNWRDEEPLSLQKAFTLFEAWYFGVCFVPKCMA